MTTVNYQALIREVPDFPKPGILFYDITTLLKDPAAIRSLSDQLTARYQDRGIRKVVGIESRGFIFGGILAARLGAGFVPARKPGKLPADCYEVKYNLEYGNSSLAVHRDAIELGEHVLISAGVAEIEIDGKDGPKKIKVRYTDVYQQQPDRMWLIVHEHLSKLPSFKAGPDA